MTTYPSVRPAVGADDRLTWSAPRRTPQARSLQTNACALVSCQNSFAVLSNVRRSTSTLAQSSSMLRAPLPATSRPQSRLAAARPQHTARLHCAGRATGADRRRQPSTVRAAVCGLLAVLLTLGKLGAAATALTAGQPAAIVAAAPARLRFVAPTSPRGEVTGGSSMRQSHTLCGSTCTHGDDDTRGTGLEPQLPRASGGLSRTQPAGAYNSCTQR